MIRLYDGNKLTGFAVVRDDKYPSMWRVRSPDGSLSDMVNLSRAKDAALAAAHLGGGHVPSWRESARPAPRTA